jgi:hypothetical protein
MKNSQKNKIKKTMVLAAAGAIALTVILGQTFAQTNIDNNNSNPSLNQTSPGTTTTTPSSQPSNNPSTNQNPNQTPSTQQTGTNTNANVDLSKTTIDDILVSDTPNQQGYVLQNAKNQIPSNASKIFATVQIGHAVAGMKVMATLIYDQDQSQIGPVEATVDTTADTTMVPFSFTTTTPPWLKGKYTVQVSIGNNVTKEFHFVVN